MGSKRNLQYVVCSISRASGISPESSLPWVLLIFYKRGKSVFIRGFVLFSAGLVHLYTKSFSDLLNLNHNAATLLLLFTFVRGKYIKTDSKMLSDWLLLLEMRVRRNAPSMIHFTMDVLCCWGHNIHSTIICDAQHLLNAPHLSGFTQTNVGLSLL